MRKYLSILLVLLLTSLTLADDGIRYGNATKNIKITNSSLNQKQTFRLNIPVFQTKEVIKSTVQTCQPVRCRFSHDGSAGNWHGAFTGPRNLKAQALSDAILGLSLREAQAMVNYGYFRTAPWDWEDFQRQIENAKADYFYHGGDLDFTIAVLDQYGYKNSVNLGYFDSEECVASEEQSCQVPQRIKEEKRIADFARDFEFVATNSVLLPFESDDIEITAGHDAEDVKISSPSSHNKYNIKANYDLASKETRIELEATSRIKGSLPSGIIKNITFNKSGQGQAQITLEIDENFIRLPEDNQNAQLEIAYKFERSGWKNEVAYESSGNKVDHRVFMSTFSTANVQVGKAYVVSVYMRVVGGRYYNEDYIQAGTSRSIKF